MISICADSPPDHATSVATNTPHDCVAAALYALEVDSPFFQLSREAVLLASEPLGGGGSGSGNSGGMSARNTARGVGPGGVGGGPSGGGVGGHNKRRDLPKKPELLQSAGRGSQYAGEASAAAGAAAEGGPAPLPETNATLLNFFPRAAGAYPCRLLVKRRMKHLMDVRCIDISATVDAPRNATALVFRAPARQKITQEVSQKCTRTDTVKGKMTMASGGGCKSERRFGGSKSHGIAVGN